MNTKNVFKYKLYKKCSIEDILPSDNTFPTFMENLKRESKGFKKNNQNDFVNSGFHSLVEAIIIHFPSIGISDYNPIESTRHKYKTHGIGKRGTDTVTVFSSIGFEKDELMTDGNSNLTEFFAQSCYIEGFDLSSKEKIFYIFTDAKALHENTIKNFVDLEQTAFYGIEEIRKMIDGNVDFWNAYKDSLTIAAPLLKKEFEPYSFQTEAINALKAQKDGRCQVILPTGGGKTEIMMEHSLYKTLKAIEFGNPNPIVLNVAPRITLGKQGITKVVNRIMQKGLKDFTIINFTSGEYDNDILAKMCSGVENIINTTNIQELWNAIRSSKGPILIFTTYHSVNKIIEARIPLILTNADEAHNIVKGRSIPKPSREALTSPLLLQNCPMVVYYTATQALSGAPDTEPPMEVTEVWREVSPASFEDGELIPATYWHSRKGYGMDNVNLFGPVIYRKKPIDLINAGVIVRPQVCHYTVTKADIESLRLSSCSAEDLEKNAELNSKIIWETFHKLEEQNEKDSLTPEKNGIKYLIKCPSGKSFAELLGCHSKSLKFDGSEIFREYQKDHPDIRIFGISSDWGIFIDGKEYPKDENSVNRFMFEMQEAKPEDKIIVLHIAMIGEGWDVPGINAIFAFNEMGDITASQTLGRGMRTHELDRPRLRNGEIVPNDCYNGKFFKPWCYVVTLDYAGLPDLTMSKVESMVECIHTNLGYYPFEIFIDEGYTGTHPVPVERDPKSYTIPEGYEDTFVCTIVRTIEERKAQSLLNAAISNVKQSVLSTITSVNDRIKKAWGNL